MVQKRFKKFVSLALAAALVFNVTSVGGMKDVIAAETEDEKDSAANASSGEYSVERLSSNYTKVSAGYTLAKYTGEDIVFSMDEIVDSSCADKIASDNYGYANGVLDISNKDTVLMNVQVEQAGLYWIGFDYLSYDESILPIEFSFKVDDEYPFYEARNLSFETTWVSEGDADLDRYGNEIVTLPTKAIRWEHKDLMDASYRYSEPLMVELSAGSHVFEITVSEGSFLLGNITLKAPTGVAPYSGSETATGGGTNHYSGRRLLREKRFRNSCCGRI